MMWRSEIGVFKTEKLLLLLEITSGVAKGGEYVFPNFSVTICHRTANL